MPLNIDAILNGRSVTFRPKNYEVGYAERPCRATMLISIDQVVGVFPFSINGPRFSEMNRARLSGGNRFVPVTNGQLFCFD